MPGSRNHPSARARRCAGLRIRPKSLRAARSTRDGRSGRNRSSLDPEPLKSLIRRSLPMPTGLHRRVRGLDLHGPRNSTKPAAGSASGWRLYSYSVAGLSVGSDIVLPGLIEAAFDGQTPDVAIARADVPLALEGAESVGPTWQILDDTFLFRIPDLARFHLTGGRRIAYALENDTPADDIAVFLIGTVFGILLHQRGHIVLHASAVSVGGKAVLFCGASGAGKSTIAAALDRQGYPVIADDVCAIDLDGPAGPMVQPDGRQLKLWSQAIEKLDLAESRREPVRRKLEKYYLEPANAAAAPLPLGAVYVLREARPPHAAGIERPNVVDCALLLRRNAYRPRLVRAMGQKADYFHAAAEIANRSGIFHLTREFGFDHLPGVLAGLRDHWSAMGLLETATA
jgi:hypothetical protein